ncbi:MAG: tRNA pseudouridine(13) synthase TruD [Epsilonproteobacteria bacterium]|nr:tRNA pseudouridine(13) synthase TruD [Campylobacterota bacterium]
MKKTYAYNQNPINFNFAQTVDRFLVEEIPLFEFANKGSYLILKIRKSDMSTFKLITVISKATKLEQRDIGYAGLKDKNATTIQYISIPKKYEKDIIKNLTTQKIEILEKKYSKFPIKIGQLKGNKFAIILNNVTPQANIEIQKVAREMEKKGIPNYYGYQRFGEDNKSYLQGKEIAHSGKKLKGAKEKLLVSAYQSHLFNEWLSKRVYISNIINTNSIEKASKMLSFPKDLVKVLADQENIFKLFIGDDMKSYPYGKSYPLQDFELSTKEFQNQKVSPTGLLCGSKTDRAMSDARYLEEEFDDQELYSVKGSRRYAWIWAKNLAFSYKESKQQLRFQFYLPKGSYATTFLEEIAKRSLK